MNPWLTFSLIFLGIWLFVWLVRPGLRKEMLGVSFFTMFFGLTEPLFVPEYWSPPSLFNLAATTGFDIESFIFSFAIGGIGSVIYETMVKRTHKRLSKHQMHERRHRFHLLALMSPIIIFLPLYLLTQLNPIYSASIAMFGGAIAAILCRPDLKEKIFTGGVVFLALYFSFFLLFNILYPGLVLKIWNLPVLSGLLILGVPLEELLFAFSFGMLWSSIYEHALWLQLMKRGD